MVSQARQMTIFPSNISSDSTAVLLHTGGTTEFEPKSVVLTHKNLLANCEQCAAWVSDLHEGAEVFYSDFAFFPRFRFNFMLFCCYTYGFDSGYFF